MSVNREIEVRNFLKRFHITPNKKGYEYLTDLLLRTMDHEVSPGFLSKTGFPVTARKLRATNSEAVERSCRNAIYCSFQNDPKPFLEILGLSTKPSISLFLFTAADHLLMEEKKKSSTSA